jgi:hypothetical protein
MKINYHLKVIIAALGATIFTIALICLFITIFNSKSEGFSDFFRYDIHCTAQYIYSKYLVFGVLFYLVLFYSIRIFSAKKII